MKATERSSSVDKADRCHRRKNSPTESLAYAQLRNQVDAPRLNANDNQRRLLHRRTQQSPKRMEANVGLR